MKNTGDARIDEVMPQLNEMWPRLRFEECLLNPQVSYRKLKQKEIQSTGKIPVIDQGERFIAGYTNKEEDKYSGSLPLIIFGDHTRRIKFVDFEFAVGADGTKLLHPIAVFDPRFFYYYLRALNLESQGYSRHYRFLKEVDVPLPPSTEQNRIVVKLDKLLSKVEACQQRLEKIPLILKWFRQAVLAAACSGKLTADWREDHPQYITGSNHIEDKGEIPETWTWRTFQSVSREITVGYVGPMAKEYVETGVPFLRSLNVRPFKFDPTNIKFISEEFHRRIKKSRLSPGDVGIVRSGNSGVACVIPESLPEANCSDLVILRPNEELEADYACLFMNSSAAQSHVNSVKVGIAQGHFNVGSMKTTLIPLPPVLEQKEIVRRVKSLFKVADQLEERYHKAKAHVDKLTQSILAKAFRGELVPTEAELARREGRDYESAAALLERIRRGRAEQPQTPKATRPARKKKDDATRKMFA